MFKMFILLTVLIMTCNCLSFNKHQFSLDYYVDFGIYQSNGNCDKLSIITLNGGAPWTSPSHPKSLQITAAQAQKVADMMRDEDFTSAQANGIVLEGVKYQLLREDGRVAFAKKNGYGAIIIQKSKMTVVIGHTPQERMQQQTNRIVGHICEYFESVGL